ncbi:hypothetical protein [Pandoraea commovens]|uniref:Uncharacterized protein n=1 Tax=Pandoraea commovens TaxID=2508289 RepID=A0A5E4VG22_9BURK|nr:hypothetical protein [Pandoraea commovens]VVE10504.1 hypothetical protein PCO31010_02623 [Pandoraea commovens]
MAKVKYLGDPSGEEHRHSIEHAGVTLARGEWSEVPDHAAKKLASNPHFEVKGIAVPKDDKQSDRDAVYLAELEATVTALQTPPADEAPVKASKK